MLHQNVQSLLLEAAALGGSLAPFYLGDFLGKPAWMWLAFMGIVSALLVFDLGVLHKGAREIKVSESLALSAFYVAAGLAFGGWVWWAMGEQAGVEYVTGFLVEKSLAMDNVFVIAMIFGYFAIPRHLQHRVLFWGILGVLVLRAIMIGLGAALVAQFGWVLYLFGAFLVVTGVKMLFFVGHEGSLEDNRLLRLMRRRLRVTPELHGERFLVRLPDPASGKVVTWLTPLALALVLIEVADLIFAVDSVPAIFAITQDTFLVYTSNIFAILGLRALYFALSAMIHRFRYLKHALALILVFIGGKIFAVNIVGKVPAELSLGVTLGLLAGGVVYSLWRSRDEGPAAAAPAPAARLAG